jgi:DNA-binding CsgD family transcriptional regulator
VSSDVLRWQDLRVVLDAAEEMHDRPPDGGVPDSVVSRLGQLIGCDLVTFCELDLLAKQVVTDQQFPAKTDADSYSPDLDRYWWHCFWQNEFCSYSERSGDRESVVALSDFYSARTLGGVLGYQEFFGDPGVCHELMACLPSGPGRSRRLLLTRGPGSRDFSDRDRTVVALLRPHLHAAWLRADTARRDTADLTPREREVLTLAADGRSNDEIARLLVVSTATVRKHLEHIFDKLGVRTRTAAAALAFPRA